METAITTDSALWTPLRDAIAAYNAANPTLTQIDADAYVAGVVAEINLSPTFAAEVADFATTHTLSVGAPVGGAVASTDPATGNISVSLVLVQGTNALNGQAVTDTSAFVGAMAHELGHSEDSFNYNLTSNIN